MERGNCVLCPEGTPTKYFLKTSDVKQQFTYYRCEGCGLVFLDPRPTEEEILEFYTKDYYGEGSQKFISWLSLPRLVFAWERVRRLQKCFQTPGRVLDVGCGEGTFLRLLKKEGWECFGTELTAEMASRASRFGVSVSTGEIHENQFPLRYIDVITFWQVLEHLRNPAKIIKSLLPSLKKKGIVAISTPNISSFQAQVFGAEWFHLDPPRHLYLFSPETLKILMESLGFDLVRLYHFSLEQDPYGWTQGMLNRTNLLQNSLYTILKNNPKYRRERLTLYHQFITVLMAMGLLPTCICLSLGMSLFKSGASIEAFFKLKVVD